MIRTVILDLDGPVLDGKLRHYDCYRRILGNYHFTPLGIDEYWELKRIGADRKQQLAPVGAESIYRILSKLGWR